MADLTITATSVVPGSDAVKVERTALSTITAGQPVYIDTSTNKVAPVDTDSATAAVRTVYGIALNGAAANQPVVVQTAGSITIGATVAVGTIYVASDTAGGIKPEADLAAGDYTSVIGIATSTTVIKLGILNGGAAQA